MADFSFEMLESYGVLSEKQSGWKKELTSVSWNDRDPKFDIREWDPEYEKMSKGVTFSQEELVKLRNLLNEMDLD